MRPIFADTFYYLALLNPSDDAHAVAREFTAEFAGNLVTSEWVLTELSDGLCLLSARRTVIRLIEKLRRDPKVRIIPCNNTMLLRGWELYRDRLDKEWSLTDCTSFVIMRQLRIADALTGDHHFVQAGFRAILK
jgi:predicted nucleic acid-binding protein